MSNFERKFKIGQGAFGAVFCCKDGRFCLKVQPENFKSVLEREGQILKALCTVQNIPRFISFTKEPNNHVGMVMTYLGPSIDQMLREALEVPALSLPSVLKIGIQMIDILAHIHAKNFTHNDVKPLNMVLGNPADKSSVSLVHLIDFGISTRIGNISSKHAQPLQTTQEAFETIFSPTLLKDSTKKQQTVRTILSQLSTQQLASHVLSCDENVTSCLSLRDAQKHGIARYCPFSNECIPVDLRGTPRFCSLRQHFGFPTRPSDDYESLAFTLLVLAGIQLPWNMEKHPHQSPEEQRQHRRQSYYNIAIRKSLLFYKLPEAQYELPSELLRRCNISKKSEYLTTRKRVAKQFPILIQFLDATTESLLPEPNILRSLLMQELDRLGEPFNTIYDWSKHLEQQYEYIPPSEEDYARNMSA